MKRFPHWGRKEGRKETRKGERGREAEGETFSLFLSFLAYDVTREERGVVGPRDGLLVCGPSPLECLLLTEEKATIPAHASGQRTEKLQNYQNLLF